MSPTRSLCALLALVLATTCCFGHEIKALASRLVLEKPGEKTPIYLSWGHRLPVDDLIDADSITRYDLLAPGGNSTALRKGDLSLQTNATTLETEGIHQVVVARKSGIFTFVLDDENKQHLKRGPKTAVKEGQIDHAIRSRQLAKALIVVGKASTESTKPAGLAFEIVALDGPVQWQGGKETPFRILLNGKPHSGVDVKARYVGFKPDSGWCYATTSSREGALTICPQQAGTWVLKASTRILTTGSTREQYDFESYTTTLSLEVLP